MLSSSIAAFIHFAAAFALVGALVFEWLTLTAAPTREQAQRIGAADAVYGLSAVALLVAGFLRVFYFEKGSAYYFANPFFHLKLTLFIVTGLLSIYPTLRFLGWRKVLAAGGTPVLQPREHALAARLIKIQLLLIVGIVLCASLMAHGVGA